MTEVDDRLRAAHERVPEPDAETTARVLARLEAQLAPKPRRRRRRLILAAAIPAAAAAVAAALAFLPGRVETPVTPPPALAACFVRSGPTQPCLLALADVAAEQRAPAASRVFYERNEFTLAIKYIGENGRSAADPAAAAYAIVRTVPEELWLAADGSGRYVYGRQGPARPGSSADARAWRNAGAPDLEALMGPAEENWGPKVQPFKPGELLFNSNLEAVLPRDDPLSVVPHERKALEAFLQRAARRQRPGEPDSQVRNTFGTDVTTFLRYPGTPPDLRSALLDVFAGVPGARMLGRIRDGAGRPAAGIDLPDDMNDGKDIIAFDPATARLVAEGTSDGHGSVRWANLYALSSGTVARVGERP
jgi:hypothetical protein